MERVHFSLSFLPRFTAFSVFMTGRTLGASYGGYDASFRSIRMQAPLHMYCIPHSLLQQGYPPVLRALLRGGAKPAPGYARVRRAMPGGETTGQSFLLRDVRNVSGGREPASVEEVR